MKRSRKFIQILKNSVVILGIDPGTARTGYGVIRYENTRVFECVSYGCIETPKSASKGNRLLQLERELARLINTYKPNLMAVETLFFFKNLKTAMPVSEARGVILLAAARKGVEVRELSPLQVKMAITGYGRADKKQMQGMVQRLLSLPVLPRPDDAADALSVALTAARLLQSSSSRLE